MTTVSAWEATIWRPKGNLLISGRSRVEKGRLHVGKDKAREHMPCMVWFEGGKRGGEAIEVRTIFSKS
jgi:hypothetical protein